MDVDETLVKDAVQALSVLLEERSKKNLLTGGDETKISMQLSFKKVPAQKQTIKIELPTPLVTKTSDVCLFVKDLDKKDRDFSSAVEHYKDILATNKISQITEVIPLKQLKLEYQPFEAKRNLCDQFDVFLADERIMRLLPGQLGSIFFKRKRHPSQVNLLAKDLKTEISRALTSTRCVITGRGSCCMVAVGHSGMTQTQLVENTVLAAKRLAEKIPGGPNNVRGLQIKSDTSMSIPIYFSDGAASEINLPQKKKKTEDVEPEDVTTVIDGKVKVDRFGRIDIVGSDRKRKLDAAADEESGEDDVGNIELAVKRKATDDNEVKASDSSDEEGEIEKMYEQRLSAKKTNMDTKKKKVPTATLR